MNHTFSVATARLDATPEVCEDAFAVLCASERQRANRFVFAADRKRFVIARATLRRLLSDYLAIAPEKIEITYGPHGKPALYDSDVFFNVSHCDDLAVYALARHAAIGIDVETVRWFADADEVAARMFSPAERSEYAALDERDRPAGFFNCWTRKEAFLKASGDGLNRALDSFDVSLKPGEPARLFRVDGWSVESFVPAPGFVAAVVVENQ